jgi:hypothetical protein
MSDLDRAAYELREEILRAISMVQTRTLVDDSAETFSIANVIGIMNMTALEYAVQRGIPPQKFIEAMHAAADQLDKELQTRTGLFAKIEP